jgi:hypothetical protein
LTATSGDGCRTKRRVVVGLGGGLRQRLEGVAEEVDGLALEADVGVHGGRDADVGVSEELLDDDEFDALFQDERRGRVPQVVELDLPEVDAAEEGVEVPGEGAGFDRVSVSLRVSLAAVSGS